MPSGRTNIFPESGRGLGHMTPTFFGSTVGYPSDSLAFGVFLFLPRFFLERFLHLCVKVPTSLLLLLDV